MCANRHRGNDDDCTYIFFVLFKINVFFYFIKEYYLFHRISRRRSVSNLADSVAELPGHGTEKMKIGQVHE